MIMEWDSSVETLLKKIADEAQIRSILHHNSHLHYKYWSFFIQIPVIILSTIAGSGNFLSTTAILEPFKDQLIFIIGAISLYVAVVSSVYKYLNLDSIVEGHRLSSLNWSKLYCDIRNQLTMAVCNRQDPNDFVKTIGADYTRINEISPFVPKKYVRAIKKKIKDEDYERPFYLGNIKHMISANEITIKDIQNHINDITANEPINQNSSTELTEVKIETV